MGIELLQNQIDWCGMEFHERLKSLREAKGITQLEAAESIGIAKNTYIGYEKGSREPRLNELKEMARLFQMSLSSLCMENHTSSVDEKLTMQFKTVATFEKSTLDCFNSVVEALFMLDTTKKQNLIRFGREGSLFGESPITEDEHWSERGQNWYD